jgi:hypothetical protein
MTIERKLFEIWCEGDPRRDYTACHLGYGKGSSLREACEDYASRNSFFSSHFNFTSMTYRGCKVHDNETTARETHG